MRLLLKHFSPLLVCLYAVAAPGYAAVLDDKVVAVVNEQIITESQWQQHCALAEAVSLAGVPASQRAAQRQALCKRALSGLVDAEIQRQYAAEQKLEPTKDELARARAQSLDNFKNVPSKLMPVAEDELRSELRWQKILLTDVRPKVKVNSADVDKVINDLGRQTVVTDREIAQILLKVPAPKQDAAVKARMQAVQQRLAKGEDFSKVASSVSEGDERANGGRMGWFGSGELNPQLERELDGLKVGQVSGLIRTPEGWHLVKLLNLRERAPISTAPVKQVRLMVVGRAVKDNETAEQKQLEDLRKVQAQLTSEDKVAAYINNPDWNASVDIGWVAEQDLQPEMLALVNALKPGQASEVRMIGGNDVVVFKAEERQVMPQNVERYRQQVQQRLFQQRMEQEARKLMRDLRQKAFIDIRA